VHGECKGGLLKKDALRGALELVVKCAALQWVLAQMLLHSIEPCSHVVPIPITLPQVRRLQQDYHSITYKTNLECLVITLTEKVIHAFSPGRERAAEDATETPCSARYWDPSCEGQG